MISPISRLEVRGRTPEQFFARVFRQQIEQLERNAIRCRIPGIYHLYERTRRCHTISSPSCSSNWAASRSSPFPDECFTLYPGEMCVVPKGMPHGERVRADKEPFENVVVSFYNDVIDVHIAREMAPGVPRSVEVNFYTTDYSRTWWRTWTGSANSASTTPGSTPRHAGPVAGGILPAPGAGGGEELAPGLGHGPRVALPVADQHNCRTRR